MLRIYARYVPAAFLLFTLTILLIRAQPYDDSALRTFMIPPPGCDAPCWLGVRPGVTHVDEAIRLLEAHEWVRAVRKNGAFYDLVWSGTQPAWIDTSFSNHFRASALIVESIRLRTHVTVGTVFLTMGRPQSGAINTPLNMAGLRHTGRYTRNGMEINSLTRCPIGHDSVWRTPVEIHYRARAVDYHPYHFNLGDWLQLRPCR